MHLVRLICSLHLTAVRITLLLLCCIDHQNEALVSLGNVLYMQAVFLVLRFCTSPIIDWEITSKMTYNVSIGTLNTAAATVNTTTLTATTL